MWFGLSLACVPGAACLVCLFRCSCSMAGAAEGTEGFDSVIVVVACVVDVEGLAGRVVVSAVLACPVVHLEAGAA